MPFIIEFFKKIKRSRSKLTICPQCKNPKISTSSPFDGWITPRKYLCRRCGYSGYIVLEKEDEAD